MENNNSYVPRVFFIIMDYVETALDLPLMRAIELKLLSQLSMDPEVAF